MNVLLRPNSMKAYRARQLWRLRESDRVDCVHSTSFSGMPMRPKGIETTLYLLRSNDNTFSMAFYCFFG